MRNATAILILAATFASQHVLAVDAFPKADPSAGKRAFDEARCQACHDKIMAADGNRLFTRTDRKITNAPALLKMVRFCIERTGASVFPEDAEHIAAYLNQQFYKFK